MRHTRREVVDRTGREFEQLDRLVLRLRPDIVRWHRRVQQQVLLTLRERPDDWFSGKERGASWPGDFDGHSAWHRVRDIEAAISGMQKNKPPSGRLSKDSPKRSVDDGRR